MPRQPILALGLVALVLTFGLRFPSSSAAETAHATAEKAVHDEGGGTPDILEFQPSLAIWTVVVFVGLLFVLGKFAWKPLLQALHQREEHLEHCLLATERARNESEQLLAQHRQQMAQAADQIRALLDEARREAQALKDDIINQARTEADAERQRARRDIENARDQALSEIWSKAAELAVSVAGKVLTKELGPDDHRRLVDSAIGELPPNPALAGGAGSPTA
jgi:F-type H+-transporting ATPase subunit b